MNHGTNKDKQVDVTVAQDGNTETNDDDHDHDHDHDHDEDSKRKRVPLNEESGDHQQDQPASLSEDQPDSLSEVPQSSHQQQPQQQQSQQEAPTFGKDKVLGIAPMLDVTTREFRHLMRILSKELTLWTEMVVDGTIIHAKDLDNHLGMDDDSLLAAGHKCYADSTSSTSSHPIVCQIGGNSPSRIFEAVQKIMTHYDYDEININMGCPSQLVAGKNMFGAVLMKHREVAKAAVEAMQQAVEQFEDPSHSITGQVENGGNQHDKKPTSSLFAKRMRLSVKCRIGVDDWDSFELLREFIQVLSPHIQIFYIHARKAVLGGKFTTKQNRAIPPLNYPWVYALCDEFPDCEFHINGGIPDLKAAKHLCLGMQTMTTKPKGSQHGQQHAEYDEKLEITSEDEKKSDDDATTDIADTTKTLDLQHQHQQASTINQSQHQQPQHQVPCSVCQFPNGSCVAAPLVVPTNLKGCMLGRAARDNPCLFWDVDRYLYGKPTNPCQNRWEVIAKYLEYIEEVVPPRCCDSNPQDTRTLPMPFQVEREYDACPLCAKFGPASMWMSDEDDRDNDSPPNADLSVAPMDYDCGGTAKPKVSSHVFSRVLRPLVGILNGVPNARKFRQEFDRLLKQEAPYKGGGKKATPNANVTGTSVALPCHRNCGPAAVIRMALLRVMDRKVLMQDFEKTEDISVDYSRSIDCCKGKRTW
ncbi:unnamed protein product [Cylindrotheca closterium]|uniref:DUS-like FMN-binding domain-containing protein n=1 Tax=Cylindrotheca closterium TaxID=2856 RepID=A0AAD2G9X1_9STRA|nr:unnamed protein product [Cylindrotheca closterium]